MDRKKAFMLIAVMVAMVIVLSICIYASVFTDGDDNEGFLVENLDKSEVYTSPYADYVGENSDVFIEGIMLCDINGDDIPELFSLHGTQETKVAKYHKFADGTVSPYEDLDEIVFDTALITEPATFYESPRSFMGLYKNKSNGERVLITSSVITDRYGDQRDNFCIVSFDGENMTVTDKSVDISEDGISSADRRRDDVMEDYELIEGGLHFAYSKSGTIDDPHSTMFSLVSKYESDAILAYGKLEDGAYYCYIKNINLDNGEAILVPAQEITLKEYTKAMEGNHILKINDESTSIQLDEREYENSGKVRLYAQGGRVYLFDEPDEDTPTVVLEGYMRRRHVLVNIDDETVVRYGITGYDSVGNPTGYETLGREKSYSVERYMKDYARYSMGSYCRVVVKGGKLQYIDILYRQ